MAEVRWGAWMRLSPVRTERWSGTDACRHIAEAAQYIDGSNFNLYIVFSSEHIRQIGAPTLKVDTGLDREVAKRTAFEGVCPYIFQCLRESTLEK